MPRPFVQWLNQKEETARYRLPTEAEWEYACRAGSQTPFFWGAVPDGRYANFADAAFAGAHPNDPYVNRQYDDARVFTAPVGSYRPNALGLHDMGGNVNEWCQDWYGNYAAGDAQDPRGPSQGDHRILRGGAWCNMAAGLRSASRGRNTPGLPVQPHRVPPRLDLLTRPLVNTPSREGRFCFSASRS